MSEATYTRPTAGSWQLFPQNLPGSLLPVFLGESLGTRLHIPNQEHNGWWLFTCDAPGVQGICVPIMSSSNLEGCVKLSMATPPSSMSAVLSFRWEVTGWEEVTSLDGRNGGEGIRSKGYFYNIVNQNVWPSFPRSTSVCCMCVQPIRMVNSRQLQHISLSPPPIPVLTFWLLSNSPTTSCDGFIMACTSLVFLLIIRCFTKNRVNNPKSTSSRQDSMSS